MSTWHALYYPLKPGSEEKVKELFGTGGRPDAQVQDEAGQPVGRLLATMAFVGREVAVRVVEIEGALAQVAAHLSRQPAIQAFERDLAEHLAVSRDMSTPEGAREFFRHAALEQVLSRRHDERG